MRVLQINSVCGIGSTGRIATDLHQILTEQGHESYVAFGRGEPQNCENAIRIGNKFDNYAHGALTRIFDRHGFGSVSATRRFINKVEELDPDIIHLHNIHGYYVNIELLFDYLRHASKPVVWTLHDCWAFTGHCCYFDYVVCDRWKTGCHNCPQKNRYPSSILMDASRENYGKKKAFFCELHNMTIVTPSQWLAELVRESYLQVYPVKVINNGIDLEIFKPTESDFRKRHGLENKFVILGVASIWEKRKGLDHFIELSKGLKSDEIIVLVGLTAKLLRDLPKNIIGLPRTNSTKELAEIYSAADVFLNPTLEDNFPTVNLEAVACGTPVITFDTGGSVEAVDESCGLVVPKDDVSRLVEVIKNMIGSDKTTLDCKKRAELFNKIAKNNEYLNLYKCIF